jgi:hypothetical protein
MRSLYVFLALIVLLTACQNKKSNLQQGTHKVVVKEVLQAGGEYTYLRVDDDGKDRWLAVDAMEANEGETYYYKTDDALPMPKWESKELKRTFDTAFLVSRISDVPINDSANNKIDPKVAHSGITGQKDNSIKIDPVAGGISIAKLFEGKDSYSGKTVLIKGKVTKFNPEIMGKNWIHLQDGTEFNGKYDLTVTSKDIEVAVGDVITVEGKISLNKDLGAGYSYDVLMEDAVKK